MIIFKSRNGEVMVDAEKNIHVLPLVPGDAVSTGFLCADLAEKLYSQQADSALGSMIMTYVMESARDVNQDTPPDECLDAYIRVWQRKHFEVKDLEERLAETVKMLKEAKEEIRLAHTKDGAVYDPTILTRIDNALTVAAQLPKGVTNE